VVANAFETAFGIGRGASTLQRTRRWRRSFAMISRWCFVLWRSVFHPRMMPRRRLSARDMQARSLGNKVVRLQWGSCVRSACG
jgi:hypothetical protein